MAHCPCPNHTKLRSNVFVHSDDQHLLISDRKEVRNNILLFAEHFLSPYTVKRAGVGKRKDETNIRKRRFPPKELRI